MLPHRYDSRFDSTKCLILGDRGVRHTPLPAGKQKRIVSLAQITVVGKILISTMSHKAKQGFFEIGSGYRKTMNETFSNRWRKANAKLCRRHSTSHCPKHSPPRNDMSTVGKDGIAGGASIEILIVGKDEIKNRKVGLKHAGPPATKEHRNTGGAENENATSRRPTVTALGRTAIEAPGG
jgi:hypothetical protein